MDSFPINEEVVARCCLEQTFSIIYTKLNIIYNRVNNNAYNEDDVRETAIMVFLYKKYAIDRIAKYNWPEGFNVKVPVYSDMRWGIEYIMNSINELIDKIGKALIIEEFITNILSGGDYYFAAEKKIPIMYTLLCSQVSYNQSVFDEFLETLDF